MNEPAHILARKIWMLAAKWQELNPTLNLYHQKAKLELSLQIEELLTGKQPTSKEIAVREARKLNVCRVCRKPMSATLENPFVFNYGEEYAHEKCIENEKSNIQ